MRNAHCCNAPMQKALGWRIEKRAPCGSRVMVDVGVALESESGMTLVTWPEKTICVGLNYLDHIAETGRTPPEYPTLFTKYARSLIGANDPIQMPNDDESTEIDWEAELGVVIGTEIRRGSEDEDEEAAGRDGHQNILIKSGY